MAIEFEQQETGVSAGSEAEIEIWAALNQIKNGGLVYIPSRDHYMATASASAMPLELVRKLLARHMIQQRKPPAAYAYELSATGRRAWNRPPRNTRLEGACDICGKTAVLRPVYETQPEKYTFVCEGCSGWEALV
jgi:hypothetical protein